MSAGRRSRGKMPVGPSLVGAIVVLALAGLALLASPAGATAAGGNGHHLILSPKAGKGLPAEPVKIRVHARRNVSPFRVSLNGHRIGRYFSKASHGVRRLQASLTYGLRHGRNLLHVRAGERKRSMRFRVWRGRPLVGAGVDRHVAAGDKVFLNGRQRSGGHRGVLAAGAGSQFAWSTAATPPGAPLTAPGPGKRGHSSFVPPIPGSYKLKLSVNGAGGSTGTDKLTVRADPPPAIPIHTITWDEHYHYGIQVGDTVYPDNPGAWAHLVALDRKTGQPVGGQLSDLADKSYDCPDAQAGNPGFVRCAAQLTQDLNRLSDKNIAIVSSSRTQVIVNGPYGIEKALLDARMIPHLTAFSKSSDLEPGSISAIGIPGQPKEGQWHAVVNPPPSEPGKAPGRMNDYLFLDNQGNYDFAPSDRVSFDTAAQGTTSDTNVIQVDQQKFPQSFSGGIRDGGGFQVLVLDPQTLQPETPGGQSQWFETDHSSQSALIDQLDSMRALLHTANQDPAHPVVVISSLGMPVIRTWSDTIDQKLSDLTSEVEAAGGTRNGFYSMLDPALYDNNSYTLVSRAGSGGGQGEQQVGTGISGDGTGPLNTAPMNGALSRTGDNYSFDVVQSQADALTGVATPSQGAADLAQVLFQQPDQTMYPPATWPGQDDPNKSAAVAWVGKQTDLKTDDPRAQYYTHGLVNNQFDYSFWNDIKTQIGNLSYPTGVSWSATDLQFAKDALTKEIGWLVAVHRYLDKLATPLVQLQAENWAKFKDIQSRIKKDVVAEGNPDAKAGTDAFFDVTRQLLDLTPGAGEAFYAANIVYDETLALERVGGLSGDDDFTASANDIGVQFTERMRKALGMLQQQVPNVISADYGKLKLAGTCALKQDTCPFDTNDWDYTGTDQNKAANALLPASEIWSYSALLPARFNAYVLPPWWKTNANGEDGYCGITLGLDAVHCPFDSEPASAQVAKPIYRNIPTYSHKVTRPGGGDAVSTGDTWQITALGYLTGQGKLLDPWVMNYPGAAVTDHLFGSPDSGGLGVDPETFFDRNFTPQTLDHYPHRETKVSWCSNIQDDNCPL